MGELTENLTDYLLQLFQSQVERGHYKRATSLLDLLSRRLPAREIDNLRNQIPEPILTEVEVRRLEKLIEALLCEADRRFSGRLGKHAFLKRSILDLAIRFNCRPVEEYRLEGILYDGRRNGYVDLVWLKGNVIAAAFEIDSSQRKKSIAKLITIDAHRRFWVYYGNRDTTKFVSRLDPDGTVTVVCTKSISARTSKGKQDKAEKPSSDHRRTETKVKKATGEGKRRQEIQKFVADRSIPHLVHFTKASNVGSILEHGLLPRRELKARLGRQYRMVEINDHLRYDNHPDANCLSISYPNYRMFYRYQQADLNKCWAVLLINSDVLWKMDCAFCTTNAASICISSTPVAKLKSMSALANLFDDYEDGSVSVARSSLSIPDYFPTNPQAEVLVFEAIPAENILSVYLNVHNESTAKYRSLWSGKVPTKINQDYFGPRVDFEHWKTQIA